MSLLYEFLERYPEFEKSDTDGDLIALFISDAKTEISEVRWGRFYKRGVMALTAHLLRLRQLAEQSQGQANRATNSENAGELSVSYQPITLTGTDADFALTAYGQEYLRLRKLVGVGVMVV